MWVHTWFDRCNEYAPAIFLNLLLKTPREYIKDTNTKLNLYLQVKKQCVHSLKRTLESIISGSYVESDLFVLVFGDFGTRRLIFEFSVPKNKWVQRMLQHFIECKKRS
jgi:hypothetical protein